METRKVQLTGGSSYIVTIPKEWAKHHGLKKNDPLGMIPQPNGTLLVTPKTTGEQLQRGKEFNISEVRDPSYLLRLLIGAYIAGYDMVTINTKRRLTPLVRTIVRDFTHLTIGQEIVEETPTSIHVKDLLDPSEMPLDRTIRRMHIISRSMHEDSINALLARNVDLVEAVTVRDTEVDRLNWLIGRQLKLLQTDISLTEKLKVSLGTASTYHQIGRIIERIGDHAVRIGRHVQNLIKRKVSPKTVEKIQKASIVSIEIFNSSLEALFKKDLKGANNNIKIVERLETLCDEIYTTALKYKGTLSLSISAIANSIRRVGEYSANISEIVINHIVSQADQ